MDDVYLQVEVGWLERQDEDEELYNKLLLTDKMRSVGTGTPETMYL